MKEVTLPQQLNSKSIVLHYRESVWRKVSSTLTCLRDGIRVESGLIQQDLIVIPAWSSIHPVASSTPPCLLTCYFTRLYHSSNLQWLPNSSTLASHLPYIPSLTSTRWLLLFSSWGKKKRAIRNFILMNAELLACFSVHVCTSYASVCPEPVASREGQ